VVWRSDVEITSVSRIIFKSKLELDSSSVVLPKKSVRSVDQKKHRRMTRPMLQGSGVRAALLVVSILAFAAPSASLGWPAFCTTPGGAGLRSLFSSATAALPSRPTAETGDAAFDAAAPDLGAESLQRFAPPKLREPSWSEVFARADALAQGTKCPCLRCGGFCVLMPAQAHSTATATSGLV
jgi:hypothetical protein